ncbi:MAG: Sec-independent protein translocase protein TatB [Pseudomonadota bacterium]|nr:Sec-independent protein translocase protein TatB [Pseudomonadota bacterium]MEC8996368.1 Sec-independent protein translocase protein TatB [Pseudomonadota bacterium]MED5274573.1 Sec-independent protein translocase protein TatB [Pseudomonadota bacterium]MED5430403.1 Sec-independent protein translocase protein TatB [Pseudomonadota bacterium]|tara:strand:+ start:1822 stop:2088 length:267 start_codon:yes stop_codon:yes gene_type:complete
MFDIGFWELFLILLLMLFVIGPERLPVVAGYMGKWFGKIQRHFSSIKDSIDQETESSDLNKIIKDQQSHMNRINDEIKTIKDDKDSSS